MLRTRFTVAGMVISMLCSVCESRSGNVKNSYTVVRQLGGCAKYSGSATSRFLMHIVTCYAAPDVRDLRLTQQPETW